MQLFPSGGGFLGLSSSTILEILILWPLEIYESIAIQPVSFLRRHMPTLGGTLVVLMTLQGILLRLFLEMLHAIFARVTYSRDPELNFRTFWLGMRDRYAFLNQRQVDWQFVHQLFGDTIQSTTSEEDLWIALQESIALCDDPSLSVSRGGSNNSNSSTVARGRKLLTAAAIKYQQQSLHIIEKNHLTAGGRHVGNNFVCGILNAQTSPGWRIGYICLTSMEGFVDFPLPRVDTLMPSWNQDALAMRSETSKSKVIVPEIYDLESMRWALEAILKSLGEIDALILDLRFNQGGGSAASALSIASFFANSKKAMLGFTTDERLPGGDIHRFSKQKKYFIPTSSSRSSRYQGPMVVLQSQYTRGTAELLCLSLMKRPRTCRIGTTTAGSLSSTRKLRLPNYWTVEIPYQRCFSADGKLYENVGIPPTKEVVDMEDLALNQSDHTDPSSPGSTKDNASVFDPCVKKAIEHIMNV